MARPAAMLVRRPLFDELRRLLTDVLALDSDTDDAPSLADMAARARIALDGMTVAERQADTRGRKVVAP